MQNFLSIGLFCLLTFGLNKQYNLTSELAKTLQDESIDSIFLDNSILFYPSLPLYLEWETGKKPILISEDLNNELQNTTSDTHIYILSQETINKLPLSVLSDFIRIDYAGLNTGRGGMLNLSVLRKKK